MRRGIRSLWGDPIWHPGPLRLLAGAAAYAGLIGGIVVAFVLFPAAAAWIYGLFLLGAVVVFVLFVLPKS